jgi:hypothetical protein
MPVEILKCSVIVYLFYEVLMLIMFFGDYIMWLWTIFPMFRKQNVPPKRWHQRPQTLRNNRRAELSSIINHRESLRNNIKFVKRLRKRS